LRGDKLFVFFFPSPSPEGDGDAGTIENLTFLFERR
jgi:hypothetical protein